MRSVPKTSPKTIGDGPETWVSQGEHSSPHLLLNGVDKQCWKHVGGCCGDVKDGGVERWGEMDIHHIPSAMDMLLSYSHGRLIV